MEVAPDRVVDEPLLLLLLASGLVPEHHVVVPAPLDREVNLRIRPDVQQRVTRRQLLGPLHVLSLARLRRLPGGFLGSVLFDALELCEERLGVVLVVVAVAVAARSVVAVAVVGVEGLRDEPRARVRVAVARGELANRVGPPRAAQPLLEVLRLLLLELGAEIALHQLLDGGLTVVPVG